LVPEKNIGSEALAQRVHAEQVPQAEQLTLPPCVTLHCQEVPPERKKYKTIKTKIMVPYKKKPK
jgi:hypothetical protein